MPSIMLVLLLALLPAAPASAQGFGACASIPTPAARLQCNDRQGAPGTSGGIPRTVPQAAVPAQGNCTPAAPCAGPRGGWYYYTQSGAKRYL